MSEPPICAKCNDLTYVIRDGEPFTCQCTIRRKTIDAIRRVKGLQDFKMLGKGCVDFGNRMAVPLVGSAVVRSQWLPMIDHIAGWVFATMTARGRTPQVLVTTCARLRSMYLGGDGDERQPGSQLARLEDYDLVVVRLLGVRNKLTPDALLEAVDFARAIWLAYPPGNTWQEGHPAWSAELEDALADAHHLDLGPPPEAGGIRKTLGLVTPKGGDDV